MKIRISRILAIAKKGFFFFFCLQALLSKNAPLKEENTENIPQNESYVATQQ